MAVGPGGTADVLAKTVGRGTALLEKALPGAEVDILGPLGSSFPAPRADTTDLLVAGGVGLPPMYMQAAAAADAHVVERSEMLYGGRGAPDLVLLPEMEAMGSPSTSPPRPARSGPRGSSPRCSRRGSSATGVVSCG